MTTTTTTRTTPRSVGVSPTAHPLDLLPAAWTGRLAAATAPTGHPDPALPDLVRLVRREAITLVATGDATRQAVNTMLARLGLDPVPGVFTVQAAAPLALTVTALTEATARTRAAAVIDADLGDLYDAQPAGEIDIVRVVDLTDPNATPPDGPVDYDIEAEVPLWVQVKATDAAHAWTRARDLLRTDLQRLPRADADPDGLIPEHVDEIDPAGALDPDAD